MDFLKNLGMVLKLYLRVQSKKSGRNSFFILLFRIFSDFERKIFQTFGQKTSRNCKNLPSAWADEQFLALKNFQKFWTVLDFLQKPLARFSNFHLRVQSKNSGRIKFFILLFRIFSDFERNFFRLLAKKLQEVVKTTFYVSRRTVCGLNFLKSWTVLDFVQKPLAWFSKFYLGVQSKNCGRISFFCFSFQNFFEFWTKNFQTFGQKISRNCQNYTLRVQTNNFWLEKFFKSFHPLWIFCRNHWHGAQTSIFVSTVKIPEEMIFLIFFL